MLGQAAAGACFAAARPLGDVFVTGGTGMLGAHVVECLAGRAGVDRLYVGMRALASAPGARKSIARAVQLDLTGEVRLPQGVRTVIHVAGEKRDESRMTLVNETGTRRLLQAAVDAGVDRFVYVSSVGVYGAKPGAGRVDESSRHVPANAYERSKEAGEIALRTLCGESGPDIVILRPSNVVSFERREGHAPLLGLVRSIRRGLFTHFGPSGRAWLNYVDVGDVARAIVVSAERAPSGGEYIVNVPVRLDDAVRCIADELGVPEPRRRLPVAAGWVLTGIVPLGARLLGRAPPFDRARLRELTNDTVYDPARLQQETGFAYSTGPELLFRSLARYYRETNAC